MGLLSTTKRRADASGATAATGEPVDAVQRARTRARQRLIGAAVLVGIGVIGFPLVFETRPRPIPVDIPIEIPRKEGAPALVMPAGRAPGTTAGSSAAPAPARPAIEPKAAAPADASIQPFAGREAAAPGEPPVAAAAPAARAGVKASPEPVDAARAVAPPPQPAAEPKPNAARPDATRARVSPDAGPAAAAEAGRFVVQVGAFADPGAARETRLKVEQLGLKTYTQVATTAAGNRIRVRVGPFSTRDDAERAMAKARGAGLAAVVLTL